METIRTQFHPSLPVVEIPVANVIGVKPAVVTDAMGNQVASCEVFITIGVMPGCPVDQFLKQWAEKMQPSRIVIPTGPLPPVNGHGHDS